MCVNEGEYNEQGPGRGQSPRPGGPSCGSDPPTLLRFIRPEQSRAGEWTPSRVSTLHPPDPPHAGGEDLRPFGPGSSLVSPSLDLHHTQTQRHTHASHDNEQNTPRIRLCRFPGCFFSSSRCDASDRTQQREHRHRATDSATDDERRTKTHTDGDDVSQLGGSLRLPWVFLVLFVVLGC